MANSKKKVAIGCQGGGMHAAFEVGVLTTILKQIGNKDPDFELVGLSGTSAGALCALMVWYGLAPKKGKGGAPDKEGTPAQAISSLEGFWEEFVAKPGVEAWLNSLTFGAHRLEEAEFPWLGLSTGGLSINPGGALYEAMTSLLPSLGVRRKYFDLEHVLDEACPEFKDIRWNDVKTRLLVGASEVKNGYETVFDSELNKTGQSAEPPSNWHQRLPLSLAGVAASGTLPSFREAQQIDKYHYWDGLYSQNPPVRDFVWDRRDAPDELWILRINPQQWLQLPKSHGEIRDRENELMGNLSLHKDLDFILKVNEWMEKIQQYTDEKIGTASFTEMSERFQLPDFLTKKVVIRTIKMRDEISDELLFSSKFDRSKKFLDELRQQGEEVAGKWLDDWRAGKAGSYPDDAAHKDRPRIASAPSASAGKPSG